MAELLAFVSLDAVVLNRESGRIERVDAARAERTPAPRDGPSNPPPAAAKSDRDEVDGRTRALNRRFDKERRKQESKARLRAFLRTGIRSDINSVTTSSHVARGGVGPARRVGGGDALVAAQRVAPRRVLEAYLRREGDTSEPGCEGEGDDPLYVREVLDALSGADNTHALNLLAAPEYDHTTGRFCASSARPRRQKEERTGDEGEDEDEDEGKGEGGNGGVCVAPEQCRAVRRRQIEARTRSVRFTGNFVSDN